MHLVARGLFEPGAHHIRPGEALDVLGFDSPDASEVLRLIGGNLHPLHFIIEGLDFVPGEKAGVDGPVNELMGEDRANGPGDVNDGRRSNVPQRQPDGSALGDAEGVGLCNAVDADVINDAEDDAIERGSFVSAGQ